jgi:hypothetical protein
MTAECVTPLSSDLDGQLRQLQNAFRILAKPEHHLRKQAIEIRQAVSSTWEHRAAQGEWFSWPTTTAPRGTRELKGICWRPRGMLGFLGYHVGETQSTPRHIRWSILEYAFECHLPPLDDLAYLLEWDRPRTAGRLKKLANTLAAFTRNAKRRDLMSYATAIDEWEGDLALLHERYYVHFFHFGWPTTNSLHCTYRLAE